MKRIILNLIACVLLMFVVSTLLFIDQARAKRKQHEVRYQETWCTEQKGEAEVILADGTRCDCVTYCHAIEFDFGDKWYEAVTQALWYGYQTGKRPGIVLILEKEKDRTYWLKLNSLILHYKLPIDTWKIEAI